MLVPHWSCRPATDLAMQNDPATRQREGQTRTLSRRSRHQCRRCWGLCGCCRTSKRSASDLNCCRSKTARTVISIEALLALAEWSICYQNSVQGDGPCETTKRGFPPAPNESDPAERIVDGSPCGEPTTRSTSSCEPCDDPAFGSSERTGGKS